MSSVRVFGLGWLRLGLWAEVDRRRSAPRGHPALRVACPHCTNTDTLSPHCPHRGCDWVSCTCGALVYTRRRHRHPRHGTTRDTCHDQGAAV